MSAPEPRLPVPVPEPAPLPVVAPVPAPIPAQASVAPQAPVPLRAPEPAPMAKPAPVPLRAPEPAPMAKPAPVPLRAPEPAPMAKPAPAPVQAMPPVPVQVPVQVPAPAPVTAPVPQEFEYIFRTSWDGTLPLTRADVTVKLTPTLVGLQIDVEAPFFDDPRLPPEISPGPVEGLWNYEVVEVFFLGPNSKYLEVELGPRGHYLVYYLEGVLRVTDKTRHLISYSAGIRSDGQRWKGTAVVAWEHLPPAVSHFNAYAIHKSYPNRVYMALYPSQYRQFPNPDFHRLQFFQPLPDQVVRAAIRH